MNKNLGKFFEEEYSLTIQIMIQKISSVPHPAHTEIRGEEGAEVKTEVYMVSNTTAKVSKNKIT